MENTTDSPGTTSRPVRPTPQTTSSSTTNASQNEAKQRDFLRELNQMISAKLRDSTLPNTSENTTDVYQNLGNTPNTGFENQNALLNSGIQNPLTVSIEDQIRERAEQDRDENGLRIDGFQEAGSHKLM